MNAETQMGLDIEGRRHSLKDGSTRDVIGSKGYQLARAIGERQLRGRGFTRLFVSPLLRTSQTMHAFIEGAGDIGLRFGPKVVPFTLEDERLQDFFRFIGQAEKRREDLFAAAQAFDDTTWRWLAERLVERFDLWTEQFCATDRVLLVNHSPSMEILLYGLTDIIIPSLRECEGFQLTCQADGWKLRTAGNDPRLGPASIRATLGL